MVSGLPTKIASSLRPASNFLLRPVALRKTRTQLARLLKSNITTCCLSLVVVMSGVVNGISNVFSEFRLGNPGTPTKNGKTRNVEDMTATKRTDYLQWEEYFMLSAVVASKRSKDPTCQVGCVIVNKRKIIVGTGYNGFPVGCSDDKFPWGKGNEDPLDNKYAYVVHAEANAILNKINDNLEGSTLYTTTFPCNECAKLIIQSRVGEVVFLHDRHEASYVASRRMFDAVKIPYRQYEMDEKKAQITVTLTNPLLQMNGKTMPEAQPQ